MTAPQQEPIETLLVLDDEPDILDAIRRLLRKRYRVLTAQSADEATRILATEEERDVFLMLIDRVSGIGPAIAMAVIRLPRAPHKRAARSAVTTGLGG